MSPLPGKQTASVSPMRYYVHCDPDYRRFYSTATAEYSSIGACPAQTCVAKVSIPSCLLRGLKRPVNPREVRQTRRRHRREPKGLAATSQQASKPQDHNRARVFTVRTTAVNIPSIQRTGIRIQLHFSASTTKKTFSRNPTGRVAPHGSRSPFYRATDGGNKSRNELSVCLYIWRIMTLLFSREVRSRRHLAVSCYLRTRRARTRAPPPMPRSPRCRKRRHTRSRPAAWPTGERARYM